ncbi:MAG: AAA family ATPase [Euryarchaeota archaeon]|nr:AAA family ATPase [Euryarchaeota archaeon]MBT3971409.1 AAA family ATPase [Euryarchaeota archaeon]MBT4406827.1 AAA family ATPase [Euryarchaeota archaeon]MBT6644275.1 AAA family ATPase [Euryarchaeota archaeon]
MSEVEGFGGSMTSEGRIATYVEGLDERMQGGIPRKHIVLVAGSSGSMKSTLTFSMLYNSVLNDNTSGIYVTLEQGKESLQSHMAGMGMNIDDPRVRNRIAIIDLAGLRVQLDEQGMSGKVDWMGQLIKQLTNYRKSIGFEVLIFDSLGAFFTLTKMDNPRDEIFRLFEAVRNLGLTAFFICEMTGEDHKQFGEYGVEDYLSDGVIHLVMDRHGDEVKRKMSIVKMRHTDHMLGYKPFNWKNVDNQFSIL